MPRSALGSSRYSAMFSTPVGSASTSVHDTFADCSSILRSADTFAASNAGLSDHLVITSAPAAARVRAGADARLARVIVTAEKLAAPDRPQRPMKPRAH